MTGVCDTDRFRTTAAESSSHKDRGREVIAWLTVRVQSPGRYVALVNAMTCLQGQRPQHPFVAA